MKTRMIEAIKAAANSEIKKHLVNIDVYLHNPVGIGEHTDIVGAVEKELDAIEKLDGRLEALEKYVEGRDSSNCFKYS
tara:strand:+ start:249 stop:482 length:234 start_codon:yes stop_codon:yes gene_type:complete